MKVRSLLKDSEKNTTDQKTSPVLHKAGASHDNTPSSYDKPYPERWPLELHEDCVGRDLEQDVGDEEHHVCHIVVSPRHVEIFLKALDLCISQIGTVINEVSCDQSRRRDEPTDQCWRSDTAT